MTQTRLDVINMELTAQEVQQVLGELGYSAPSFLLDKFMQLVKTKKDCMTANGYSEDTIWLVSLYACVLLVVSQGARRILSQSAPSGASRTFQYGKNGADQILGLLKSLDSAGCTADLPISLAGVGFIEVA